MPSRFTDVRSSNPSERFKTGFRSLGKSFRTPTATLLNRHLHEWNIWSLWNSLQAPFGTHLGPILTHFGIPNGRPGHHLGSFGTSEGHSRKTHGPETRRPRKSSYVSNGMPTFGRRQGRGLSPTPGPRNLNENPARRAFGKNKETRQ